MDWIPEYVHIPDIPSVDEFPMTLYYGPIGERGTIPFHELQNFTNFDRMPRRNILEGWPVYRSMAEIDDMVTYIPEEGLLTMMYLTSPLLECKKAKANVLWMIREFMYMTLHSHLRLYTYLMMGMRLSR